MQKYQHDQAGNQDGQNEVLLDGCHRLTGEFGVVGHDCHLSSGGQFLAQLFNHLANRVGHLDGIGVAGFDNADIDRILAVVAQHLALAFETFTY